MLNVQSPRFLRNVLLLDAATSLACGLLLTLAARPLAGLLGLPQALLTEAGLILLPFAGLVVYAATRTPLSRPLVWVAIVANALWALDSVALLLSGWVAPSRLGVAFVLAQAIVVALLAELEFFGLKRARLAVA
jgi:glucose uptake protein GlcU